jgi:hypothetical protein
MASLDLLLLEATRKARRNSVKRTLNEVKGPDRLEDQADCELEEKR